MSAEMTMAAVEAHFEYVNWNSAAKRPGHVGEAFIWTCRAEDQVFRGPDGYAACLARWRRAFPGCWFEVQSFDVASTSIVCQLVLRGAHRGLLETSFGLIAATGKPVDLPICEIYRTCGARLAAIESYFDLSTLVRQLGRGPSYRLPSLEMLTIN